MNQLAETIPRAYRIRVLWALSAASLGCGLMNSAQYLLHGHFRFVFLYWNLILAWIPMLFAMMAFRLHSAAPGARPAALWFCAGGWFIFFPNAPYIVTDFVHLSETDRQSMWYLDLLVILSFAWTGLCLGYLSLYLMQEIVRSRFGSVLSWGFALGVLALSSFGIYLGRFSRWNSWDVFRHPAGLMRDSVRAINPFANLAPLAFSGALCLFLLLSYCALFAMTNLHGRAAGD